jgi:hypothetical protein
MAIRKPRPIYTVKLRGSSEGSDVRELRLLLKKLLRSFGLRCVSVRQESRGS